MAAAIKLTITAVLIIAIVANYVSAADPDPLQDVCPADLNSDVRVNGYPCKSTFKASDFTYHGLGEAGDTNNSYGSKVTEADVQSFPGLNTLGVSMNRVDYAPGGLNPPHHHPRATEILFVLYGKLYVGFVTTDNVFVSTSIKQGEIFVFPRGLVHFQKNYGDVPAAVIVSFNSQLPGVEFEAAALFNSTLKVPDDVLAQAFHISTEQVEGIRSAFTKEGLDSV